MDPDAVPRPVAHAMVTAERIVIDGRLDEASWARAEPLTDFVQSVPFTGHPASQRTVARILYNADHLYVAAVCFDTEIEKMMVAGLEHDFNPGAGDIFGVTLDTFLVPQKGIIIHHILKCVIAVISPVSCCIKFDILGSLLYEERPWSDERNDLRRFSDTREYARPEQIVNTGADEKSLVQVQIAADNS